jgi:hypothetical protein
MSAIFCVDIEFVTLQEHANVFAAMMNNSQLVNFVDGFIKDLSGAATEVQKEAKVCSSYLYSTPSVPKYKTQLTLHGL